MTRSSSTASYLQARWSQLRDISIRIDEDAERGTPLNVGKYYVPKIVHANPIAQTPFFIL